MKVLLLGPLPSGSVAGGAERHFTGLISALSKLPGFDIEIATVSKGGADINELPGNLNINIIESPSYLPWSLSGATIDYGKIAALARGVKPDLIHAQMLDVPYGTAAALLADKYPAVITVHSLPHWDYLHKRRNWKKLLHDPVFRKLADYQTKRAHALIPVSAHLEEVLVSKGSTGHIEVIPNGVDDFFFADRDACQGLLLFVGRIMPVKGLDFLIKSLSALKKKQAGFNLKIVGPVIDWVYFDQLKMLTETLGLSGNIEFLPAAKDHELKALYRECNALVLPSRSESLPMVIMEAMASGAPIIGTKVGGMHGLVEQGKNGYLIDYGDIEAMSKAIETIINNRELCNSMEKQSRKMAEDFRWSKVAERTAGLYNSIVGRSVPVHARD